MCIKRVQRVINVIQIIGAVIILGGLWVVHWENVVFSSIIIAGILVIYVFLLAIQLFSFINKLEYLYPFFVLIAAIMSLACMTIVPEIPFRAYLPFILLSFIPITYIFGSILLKKKGIGAIICVIIIASISIPSAKKIYDGYKENYTICLENDKRLKESSKEGKNRIEFKKLQEVLYAGEMPYYEGFEFIEVWMKNYYNLSSEVKFEYN